MEKIICNKCNILVSKENRVRYTGVGGYQKICRQCSNKRVAKNNKKKQKALKEWKAYYN